MSFKELKLLLLMLFTKQSQMLKDSAILGSASGLAISSAKGTTSSLKNTPRLTTRVNTQPEPFRDRDHRHYHSGKIEFPQFDGLDRGGFLDVNIISK